MVNKFVLSEPGRGTRNLRCTLARWMPQGEQPEDLGCYLDALGYAVAFQKCMEHETEIVEHVEKLREWVTSNVKACY